MLEPGATLTVGSHTVTVIKFLSEGGYSRIYKVEMNNKESPDSEEPSEPSEPQIACLKQVKVADKHGLTELRKEVDVMRTLRDARNIVKYFDSNAERMPDGTYQVLVLMELCPNKSLLEYMNAHIREKLTEPQILAIMMDIAVAVYEMHRIQLIHRDIKIENVLIDAAHRFKLCDFGSVATAIRPPKDQQEFQVLSHDILYHTTPQYRSPEMLDLTRGFPIDEKSDIWAIGCFLYKLCYYTTPFEAAGDIAILHASFQFPPDPPAPLYSGDLKNLIIIMLQQDPRFRPNIVQIIMLLAKMCNKEFSEMKIDDYTRAGPYDFAALYEMQKEKQKQLLQQQEQQLLLQQQQQQQYYLEQQKQIQQRTAKVQNVPPKIDVHAESNEPGSSTQSPLLNQAMMASKSGEKIPGSTSKPADIPIFKVPSHLQTRSGHATPARPSSTVNYQNDGTLHPNEGASSLPKRSLSLHMRNVSLRKSNLEDEHTEDIDFLDLGNLDDVENRFPSLDALNDGSSVAGKVPATLDTQLTNHGHHQKKSSELENVEAWEKARSKALDSNTERLASDIFGPGSNASSLNLNASANVSANTNVNANANVNANNNVSEPTASRPVAVPETPKSTHSRHTSRTSAADEFVTPSSRRVSDRSANELQPPIHFPASPVIPAKEFKLPDEKKLDAQICQQYNVGQDYSKPNPEYGIPSQEVSPLARTIQPQNINLQPYLQPVSRVTSRNQPAGAPVSQGIQMPQNQPGTQGQVMQGQVIQGVQGGQGSVPQKASHNMAAQPQSGPLQKAQVQGYPQFQGNSPYIAPAKPVSSSNPWGDALDRTPKLDAKSAVSQVSKIQDFDLTKQILNLALDDLNPVSGLIKPSKPTHNLIELEVGLSSSSSLNIAPAPQKSSSKDSSYSEELSLIDLDGQAELTKLRTTDEANPKPVFKKSYPGLRDQGTHFQEEVIDFASDDENNKSDLSRVAIRQSLKKTRKGSDHRRSDSAPRRSESVGRRSESSNGESKKRLSFFSQGTS